MFGDFAYAYAEYLDELGVHHPTWTAPTARPPVCPNAKDAASLPQRAVRKLELQWAGRYRYLWWRKATVELPRHLARYLDWFVVRVVRIKSITGKRKEVPRAQLREFR